MGNDTEQKRREYDPSEYGPDVGLQIVPIPTRKEEEERRDGWRPEYGDVSEIIKRNRLPDINPKKTPVLN